MVGSFAKPIFITETDKQSPQQTCDAPSEHNYPTATLPRSWSLYESNISRSGKRRPPPSHR
eukprot:5862810-Pyramimonas_sp.AAC.1